jgi:hypothetical protein
MKGHLSPEKKNEVLRLLQGPVKFMKLNEPQKRAMRMQIERKVGNLLEIKHTSRSFFLEQLQTDFRRVFEANYGLEKQIRDLLERHWGGE